MRAARALVAAAWVAGACAALLWLAPPAASAEGLSAQVFQPSMDSFGLFVVERAETSPQWDFGFKLVANYARAPLALDLLDAGGLPRRATVLAHSLGFDLVGSLALSSWLQLSLDFPMVHVWLGDGYGRPADGGSAATGYYALWGGDQNLAPATTTVGDIRAAAKARLLRTRPLSLALAVVVGFPYGSERSFTGERGVVVEPKLILDLAFDRIGMAVNLGYRIRQGAKVQDPGLPERVVLEVDDELTWAVGAAVRAHRLIGLSLEAYGMVPTVAGQDRPVELLGGVSTYPTREISIGLGVGGAVLSNACRRDDLRVIGTLAWAPRETPLAVKVSDADGDGTVDDFDLCPGVAGPIDNQGCPDKDSDGDGLFDRLDRCPFQTGREENRGCPDSDRDADGVVDRVDACPDDQGSAEHRGCPPPDRDQDGTADAGDRCPEQAGPADNGGCPLPVIARGRLLVSETVRFEFGSATLHPASRPLLDAVARKLGDSPQVKRLRVEGHSDDVGEPQNNLALSAARAEAVRQYLLARGIAPERVTAKGYGADKPIASNRSAVGRARNRRVEFVIEEQ